MEEFSMKKRIFSMILCVLMVFGLTGCIGNETMEITNSSFSALDLTLDYKVEGITRRDATKVDAPDFVAMIATTAEELTALKKDASNESGSPAYIKNHPTLVLHADVSKEFDAFQKNPKSTYSSKATVTVPDELAGKEIYVRTAFLVKATIAGKVQDGYVASSNVVKLTVPALHNVTVGTVANGTVTVDKTKAAAGAVVTVTATPNDHYALTGITTSPELTLTDNKFTMPDSDVTVSATFVEDVKYTVSVDPTVNGTVSVSTTETYAGETVTVTATPDAGYELDTILVDGTAITGSTFTMPASNVTVTVTFKALPTYDITCGTCENGSVSADKTATYAGDTVTVTATPDAGYELDAILVDGTAITGNTFPMPEHAVTVTAVFNAIDYNVTVASAQNGTVSVSAETAHVGDTVTITAAPADHYAVDTVSVVDARGNAVTVTDNAFTMPASDVTVTVTFKQLPYNVTVGTVQNGTVTVDKSTAAPGETVTVTAAPNAGYRLGSIAVNGTAITGNTFTMPGEDVTVTATFEAIEYTITVAPAQNGTVSVSAETAHVGDTVTITTVPADGYVVDTVSVIDTNSAAVAVSGNSFTMPASNVTVTVTFKSTHTHTFDGWKSDANQHWHECSCGEKTDIADHTFGSERKCTVCGYSATYKIISGANSSWDKLKNSTSDLKIVSNAPFAKFDGVEVDGKIVKSSNYTAAEGSTAITFKASYLKTLANGKHTVKVLSKDGVASTNLTITYNSSTAKTGDSANMTLWIVLLLAAAMVMTGTILFGKVKKSKN